MTRYYDVALINKKKNRKISYLADSFSVNEDRILKIKSMEYGDVNVKITSDEELSVNEIELKDYWDGLDYFEGAKQMNNQIKEEGLTDAYLLGKYDGIKQGKEEAIDEFADWLVEQGILGNRCISDGEITDYGKVYAKKYKEQLKENK